METTGTGWMVIVVSTCAPGQLFAVGVTVYVTVPVAVLGGALVNVWLIVVGSAGPAEPLLAPLTPLDTAVQI